MSRVRPGTHAVEGGKIVYTSVSQLRRFDENEEGGCARRWYYRYVMHLPEPQSLAAKKGEDIHAQLEHYLKTGEDVLGPEARAGKHFLPEPSPDLLIEAPLQGHLDSAGVPFIGFIDLIIPGKPIEVVDHKSTSNVKYAKSGADLEQDTQMLGYGEFVRRRFELSGDDLVRLRHIYYQTRGPKLAIESATCLPLKTVNSRWQSKTEPIVEAMKVAAGEKDPKAVKANEESCYSYGKPCPYMAQCIESPITRLGMTLFSKLQNTGAPKDLPPPAAVTSDGMKYSTQQQELLKVDRDGNPIGKLLIEDKIEEAAGVITVPVSILPPDAPPSNPELEAECAPCADAGKGGQQHLKAECPTINAPPAEPKKRGRPKKTETSVPPLARSADAATPASSPVVTPPAPSEVANGGTYTTSSNGVVAANAIGFDLYIDAVPSMPYTDLSRYVSELHRAVIVEGAGQPDVALVEYGKGKGLMRAAATMQPPTGVCVIFSSDLTAPVIEALAPLARVVVRGVR